MYPASGLAVAIFVGFVAFVLWISYYFAKRTKSAEGYFAAGGQIHWAVNGIAFAGDYLSAASFLGICGMIAVYGYDGFLYSIGYLAGWIVALFVVAEPMKRLGKYTFADALDSKFNSKGIQLTVALSTLVVSMFYLIPQMVGAGALVTPLLGLPHWMGVVMVGTIVTIIVATAGMASTTYVQFLKGGFLIIFSLVLVFAALNQGFHESPKRGPDAAAYPDYKTLTATVDADGKVVTAGDLIAVDSMATKKNTFVKMKETDGKISWWHKTTDDEGKVVVTQAHWKTKLATPIEDSNGKPVDTLLDGVPITDSKPLQAGHISKLVHEGEEVDEAENLNPVEFLGDIKNSEVVRFLKAKVTDGQDKVTVFYQVKTPGKDIMKPGLKFKVDAKKGATTLDKLNFASLMLALFCGTASLPHILIRYYTVPSPACARKSTIVAILAIGLFYVLTMFMGLGAMVNGVVDVSSNNMSAPLLAKTFGITLFAIISAVAFATVLGTVSGLIVAASGAVAHDLIDNFLGIKMSDKGKVAAGKIAAIGAGLVAVILGIMFKGMNVSFLVGWAFAVAASANLPAIIMLLFWKKTTKRGIALSVVVGMLSAIGLILLSPDMYVRYGLTADAAPVKLGNPGIISIPLSFLTLVVVSLFTQPKEQTVKA